MTKSGSWTALDRVVKVGPAADAIEYTVCQFVSSHIIVIISISSSSSNSSSTGLLSGSTATHGDYTPYIPSVSSRLVR